jgi:hypothetical protein
MWIRRLIVPVLPEGSPEKKVSHLASNFSFAIGCIISPKKTPLFSGKEFKDPSAPIPRDLVVRIYLNSIASTDSVNANAATKVKK